MAIYILGREIRHAKDSVEFVRKYKEQMLGEAFAPIKYMFVEIPEQKEVNDNRSAGIDVKQLVGMHQYLMGNRTLELSIKAEEKLEELKGILHCTDVSYRDTEIWLIKDGYVIASMLLDEEDKDFIRAICYFSYAKLLRMEVYTDGIAYMNSYITATSKQGLYAKLAKRTFYNKDGSVACDQIFEGDKEWFLFPDGRLCTKLQMMEEFIEKLNLSEEDVVLLDDSVPNGLLRAVFMFGKAARLVALVHANHDYVKEEEEEEIFWKSHYTWWLPYTEILDTVVVSTKEQKESLLKELKRYHCNVPDIKVAPIEGEFDSVVLCELEDGELTLSWKFLGKANGFWIYDKFGTRVCEIRNMNQQCFLIKEYQKENGFVIRAFVDTAKGKSAVAESKLIGVSEKKVVNVMDMQETLKYIKTRQISVARFGDGEVDLMTGHSIPYQDYDEKLAKRLKRIITMPDNDKLLVCLPDVFEGRRRYNDACNFFWKQHLERYRNFYTEIIASDKCYGSTFLSRPYIDLVDKSVSGKHFQDMKELFGDKDILIVEGFYSRSGVGNDLFEGAKSIERIICPSRNAYSKYGLILDTIRQHGMDKLILLMLGPTAKVLACDLAFEGYWVVDIGHIDSEYEWYKMGATHKIKFKNKHAAEFNFDENIELQNDERYTKEIVAMLCDERLTREE